MPQWADIMKFVEEGQRRVAMVKFEEQQRPEEDLTLPLDGCRQPEAPWSQREQRRETAGGFKRDAMEIFKI
jgi:hypothetical protein